jgi:hypothetical protein
VFGIQAVELLQADAEGVVGVEELQDGGAILPLAEWVEHVTGGWEGSAAVPGNAKDLPRDEPIRLDARIQFDQVKVQPAPLLVASAHILQGFFGGTNGVELLAGQGVGLFSRPEFLDAKHQAGMFRTLGSIAVVVVEGIEGFEQLDADAESLGQTLTGVFELPEGHFPAGLLGKE